MRTIGVADDVGLRTTVTIALVSLLALHVVASTATQRIHIRVMETGTETPLKLVEITLKNDDTKAILVRGITNVDGEFKATIDASITRVSVECVRRGYQRNPEVRTIAPAASPALTVDLINEKGDAAYIRRAVEQLLRTAEASGLRTSQELYESGWSRLSKLPAAVRLEALDQLTKSASSHAATATLPVTSLPVNCFVVGQFPVIDAAVRPQTVLQFARVYFSSQLVRESYVVMERSNQDTLIARLPQPANRSVSVTYQIRAMTDNGDIINLDPVAPRIVSRAEECSEGRAARPGSAGKVTVFSDSGDVWHISGMR
jgi:hypothetical protein